MGTTKLIRRRLLILHRPSVYAEFWKVAGSAAVNWSPDIVHAHDLNALPAALRASRGRDILVVYDSHELWRHRNRVTPFHPLGRTFDHFQERRLIRRVDLVITVGGCIEDWLRRTYGLPHDRTIVVRNVPWSRDSVASHTPQLRELADLPTETILIYTGRVTSGRGIEEAIQALSALADDVHFVMLGYGDRDYLETVFSLAQRMGVSQRVHLVPPVPSEQVPHVASQADVALVAIQPLCLSYHLSLPNKLFEAIQGGVPVVASDLPEIRRIVERYGVGELFGAADARAFASALQKILDNKARYKAGLAEAAAELCWENEQLVLKAAYERLLPPVTRRPG